MLARRRVQNELISWCLDSSTSLRFPASFALDLMGLFPPAIRRGRLRGAAGLVSSGVPLCGAYLAQLAGGLGFRIRYSHQSRIAVGLCAYPPANLLWCGATLGHPSLPAGSHCTRGTFPLAASLASTSTLILLSSCLRRAGSSSTPDVCRPRTARALQCRLRWPLWTSLLLPTLRPVPSV